jgi:hypothetical protein
MANVERGVVHGSNKEGPGGDRRANGFMPLSGSAATVHPANMAAGGDRRANGSVSLSGGAPTINPPNHKFEAGMVKMPQPESAIEPGRGTVPVNPFVAGGAAARSLPVADMAKGK